MREAQRRRRAALVALAMIGTSAGASASPPPCCADHRASEVAHRGQYEVGPWVSFLWLEGYRGVLFGARFAGGWQRGRWLLGGEAEVASASLIVATWTGTLAICTTGTAGTW